MSTVSNGNEVSIESYVEALKKFDASVCEALAVGQRSAGRLSPKHIGHSSKIFARLCAHAHCMVRAAPMSRWVKATYHHWDVSGLAGHTRAIMEGFLLYMYLSETPLSDEEFSAKLKIMHINDCVRRIKVFTTIENEEASYFIEQHERLKSELNDNEYFVSLSEAVKKKCLNGKYLMINTRDELLNRYEIDKDNFDMIFDVLSNYIHILPISFYNMEVNGRGTGLFNVADLTVLKLCLEICTEILEHCTDRVVGFFPDVQQYRKGTKSIISPGPKENLPKIDGKRDKKK